ncbi:MAG TPA: TraB/GumN family protein [Steroidobacteraceae bacterium]|nr:TraB/GumN family protein [Steroidobacteraceae bacterium]
MTRALILCALAMWSPGAGSALASEPALEEVLVVGEHPGPGLWKVSKQSHLLYILGTHTPLPKDLVWRSREVEAAIARSNEVLGAYSVALRVDQEAAFQSRRGKLKDILPARTYAQWRELRIKYIDEDEQTDRLLPAAGAMLLQARAYERSGLAYSDAVWREIYQLARKHGVPVWPQDYDTRLVAGEWRRTGKARQNGIRYLSETMNRLSSDIRQARASANSWATGDIPALRELAETDASYARLLAYSWPFLTEKEVQRLHTEAENKLLTAMERAMNRNEVTFAALPIHLLLRKDGVIARLRAAGYSIEEPD